MESVKKEKRVKKNVEKGKVQEKKLKSNNKIERKMKKKTVKKKVKRKNYSSESLQRALEAVKKGPTFRKAADTYGVTSATIYRLNRNPEKINIKSGPPTVLFDYEEEEIVNWVKYRAERGYPVTKS